MITVKPPADFHFGTAIVNFVTQVEHACTMGDVILDLSDVIFMDSFTFRAVFNLLPKLKKVIPPRSQYVIDNYNMWLDGKKGLSK